MNQTHILQYGLTKEFDCKCCGLSESDIRFVCHGCIINALKEEIRRLQGVLKTQLLASNSSKEYQNNVGDWGALPQEPCRFCRRVGGVMFQLNEGQKNLNDPQVVRCSNCGKDWVADSSLA